MKILCGGCGRQIQVDDDLAGTEFQCEFCSRIIHVPDLAAQFGDAAAGAPAPAEGEDLAEDFLSKARLALRKKLLVVCESCGERLAVEERLAGNVARCPSCGEQLQIPAVARDVPADSEELMTEVDHPAALDLAGRAAESASVGPVRSPPPAAGRPVRPRRVRRRPLRRRRNVAPVVLLIVVVSLLTGLLGVLMGRLWEKGRAPVDDFGLPEPHPVAPRHPSAPAPSPRPEPQSRPAAPVPPPEPEPAPPPLARVEVTAARISGLGPDGLVPAPLGKCYVEVTADVTAGSEALNVEAAGGVVLASGGTEFAAIVRPADGPLPLVARASAATVPAVGSQTESFVFVVPATVRTGTIEVLGVGAAPLGRIERTDAPPVEALAGAYEETSRRLKVAFDHPAMERVRASGKGRLVVTPDGDEFLVRLSTAGLAGAAQFEREGTYKALLAGRDGDLSCHLRLIDGGSKLVLYLADKPYHHVIYRRL